MKRLGRDDLRGKGQTVLGLVDPDEFGATLMHEHILCDIRPPKYRSDENPEGRKIDPCDYWPINYGEVIAPGNYQLDEVELATDEITLMMEEGGQTVVDVSCGGLHPDPHGLVKVSRETGAHVVLGCGHYVNDYQAAENNTRSVESFAAEMVDQICVGAWGTDVRAGIIGEIGCQSPWTDLEKRVMEGAVIAMQETGASMSVHPGREEDKPQEIADFLMERGVDMSRVVMSHVDRTIFDRDWLFKLADTGCVIEYDLFGMENSYYKWNEEVDMPNDALRLTNIRSLLDHGYTDQVTISHDICYRTRLRAFGGHGYGHIFRNVVPYMKRRDFTVAEIEQILVGTPKRLLTFI